MKCDPWEQYEEDFLREVASSMTADDIGDKLDRTSSSVFNKASRMAIRLTSLKACKPWNQIEEEMIATLPARMVADRTGRSIYAVRAKRYKLSRREAA